MPLTPASRVATSGQPPVCPWCHGELTVVSTVALEDLVPGGVRALPDATLPAEVQGLPAMVCKTPHCRYRAALRPSTTVRPRA